MNTVKNRVIFCHDNRFQTKNNKYYSNGIFINDNMHRYTDVFDEVIVIAREEKISETSKLVEIKNSRVTFKCLKGLRDLFTIETRREIKEEVKKADYIIARVPSFISLQVIKYAKKYDKPYLVEVVGDAWGALWNHSFIGKIVAPYIELMTKKRVKEAKYALYVTNKYLQQKYPSIGESINCSNVELDKVENDILKNKIQNIDIIKDKFLISTIAAVDVKYKGQEYVIKAISKLKKIGYDFEYIIIGNGNQTRLSKISKKEKIEDKIHFIGGVPHNKIFEILDNIDIYIQPSTAAEGLPRAMIEAMSRGCLCIGTNVSGIPELVDPKYIFKKKKTKELITILANVKNEELIEQAKQNFKEAKKYEREFLKKKRREFYKSFMEKYSNEPIKEYKGE